MCVEATAPQPFPSPLCSPGLHHSLLLLWEIAALKGAAKRVRVELELPSKELL